MDQQHDYRFLPCWARDTASGAALHRSWLALCQPSPARRVEARWSSTEGLAGVAPNVDLILEIEDYATRRHPTALLDGLLERTAAGDDTAAMVVIYTLVNSTCWARRSWLNVIDPDLELLFDAATGVGLSAAPGTSMTDLTSRTRSRLRRRHLAAQSSRPSTVEFVPLDHELSTAVDETPSAAETRATLAKLAAAYPDLVARRLGLKPGTDSQRRQDRRVLVRFAGSSQDCGV